MRYQGLEARPDQIYCYKVWFESNEAIINCLLANRVRSGWMSWPRIAASSSCGPVCRGRIPWGKAVPSIQTRKAEREFGLPAQLLQRLMQTRLLRFDLGQDLARPDAVS